MELFCLLMVSASLAQNGFGNIPMIDAAASPRLATACTWRRPCEYTYATWATCLHFPGHPGDLLGRQHLQGDRDIGLGRIQQRVVELLGDGKLCDAHRHDSLRAPDEKHRRHLGVRHGLLL